MFTYEQPKEKYTVSLYKNAMNVAAELTPYAELYDILEWKGVDY